jgi:hypothetical protein
VRQDCINVPKVLHPRKFAWKAVCTEDRNIRRHSKQFDPPWRHNVRDFCISDLSYGTLLSVDRTRMHAHSHAPGHTHAHTQICNIYCYPTVTLIHKRPQWYVTRTLCVLFFIPTRFSQSCDHLLGILW